MFYGCNLNTKVSLHPPDSGCCLVSGTGGKIGVRGVSPSGSGDVALRDCWADVCGISQPAAAGGPRVAVNIQNAKWFLVQPSLSRGGQYLTATPNPHAAAIASMCL